MHRMRFAILTVFAALAVSLAAQDKTPLKLVATIPLPGLHDGDFDHFAPDVEGHRLFLTAEENEKVQVLDTSSNQLIHTIGDVKAPHAILFRKDLKKLFIVEADASAAKFNASEMKKTAWEVKVYL